MTLVDCGGRGAGVAVPLMALGVRHAYINDRMHAIGRTGTSSRVRAIGIANRWCTMVCRRYLKLGRGVGEGLNPYAPPNGEPSTWWCGVRRCHGPATAQCLVECHRGRGLLALHLGEG